MRADPVLELARRGAVRLAFGGGSVLSVVAVIQVLTGDPSGAITLVATVPITVLSFVMLRHERPNVIALGALIVGLALSAEAFAAIAGNPEYVAGMGSEVIVFGVGVLAVFIARRHPRRVAVWFLLAAVADVVIVQLSLNGPSLEIVSDTLLAVFVLGTLMYLVIRVMESLAVSQSRFSDLANVIPVATLEFDISRVIGRLQGLPEAPRVGSMDADLYRGLMRGIKLSYANHMARKLVRVFGDWDEFVIGPNLPRVRTIASTMFTAIWEGERVGSGEVTFTLVDDTERDYIYQWALGRVSRRSAPGRLVIASTDVTRLRHAEHELTRQLEEREQFIAAVSHELRTPLTSIMGLTEELVNRPLAFGPEEQAELLRIVASETRDVVDIVEDLLVAARAEAGHLTVNVEPCDLGAEAQRVAELLGDVSIDAGEVPTLADPVRLRQVLRNLISNAHRHGGDNVRVVVAASNGSALVEVRDSGDPLTPEDRDRIFLPYERTRLGGVVGSVGLGLHVARLLTRLMGGDLTYLHDGIETIFRLELPAREGQVSDEELNVGAGGEVEERSRTGNVATLD